MLKNYTDQKSIEDYLLTDVDLSFADQIEDWIESQESYIDQETGRNFKADASASERLYDGDNDITLFIDDAVEVTGVKVDGKSVDFYKYPANSLPITKIVLKDGRFTKGRQNVAVTAKWGYSEDVPADIKFAATVLVAGIINDQSVRQEGNVKSVSIGSYSVSYGDVKQWNDFENVKPSLAKYQRMTV